MTAIEHLRVKLFADGANVADMMALARKPFIRGFTTNPTLMRKAAVADYERFAREALAAIPDRPISFEVLADDFREMECQAREIAGWGANVFVKIPVTNTEGQPSFSLIDRLSHSGIKVNVTAVMTIDQVKRAADALAGGAPSNISMFAGRIADTGRDPAPLFGDALMALAGHTSIELIWASPRELLNIFQADAVGCHIITVTTDLLHKLDCIGKSLDLFSLETVRMFRDDAIKAGYTLKGQGLLT